MENLNTKGKEDLNDGESIFALAPFPMWIFDLESLKFLTVNREAIRHYGYSKTEFLSMTIEEIRPVEDIPKFEKAIENVRNRTELFKEGLFRHQKNDGSIITVQIKGNLITYKGRKAELITAIDLTERHEEQKRIEKQKRYLETIEKINDTLLKSDDWSSALDQCFEITGETLKIDRIYFFQNDLKKEMTSQRLEWTRNTIESEIDNPKLQNIPFSEFPLFMEPLRNGKNFQAIVSELPSSSTKEILQEQDIRSIFVAPVISHNSFIGFIGMDDCTIERKWAVEESQIIKSLTTNLAHVIARHTIQTELANNEYKFRTIVQKGSDLIAILNEEGIFQYVNHSSIEVLGLPPEQFNGKNVNEFIHPEDVLQVEECLKEVLEKDAVSIPPFRFPDTTGSYRWLETKLTNLLDDPVISGIVANTWDVTSEMERKIERDLLDSISKAIGHSTSLKESLGHVLLELLNLTGICLGEAWLKSQDESRLDLRAFRYNTSELKSFYATPSPVNSFDFGDGLPGYLWKNKNTALWSRIADCKIFFRNEAAKIAGLQTAIGIPIVYNDEFLGCFILFSQQNKSRLADVEKILKEVGDKLGAVVKQKIIEDEYRNFFEISPDPHCIIGFDGYLKKFNHAFRQLLGYEESTLLNNHISSFIHEEDKEKALQKLESSIADQTSGSLTVRFRNIDGRIKWLIWSSTIISEAKIFVAVAKDITEQKAAEQELKKTYNRLRKAQTIARLGYWTKEFHSEDSEWSEETYKIFGYTPENFNPTMENVTMAFHPDDRHLIKGGPKENLIPNKIKSFEHRILKASGEVRWVRQEIQLVMDERGHALSIEGTIQDITERKESEEQLKISNERFRLAMKASNEMIWEIDHNKNIVHRGTGYEDEMNYKLSEPYNAENSWCSKIYPEDIQRIWDTFQHALIDPNKSYWKEEYRVLSDNGTVFYFVDRCYIYRDEKGNAIRSVGSVLDVTLSRQQLEQIKFQNKNLKEIAWLQSHVIRAPLSKILGLIGLAKDYEGGGLSFEEIFDMIAISAHELDEVIRKIAHKTEIIEKDDTRNSAH